MAKITRYSGNLLAFASAALGTERTIFGDTAQSDDLTDNITADFFRGWGIILASEVPTKQDFNGLAYTMSQVLAYLHQVGVPEWQVAQEFHAGAFTNRNGVLYFSLTNTNVGNDPELTLGTEWEYLQAENLGYDNTASGLVAELVQDAIDEVAAAVVKQPGDIVQVVSFQTGAVATGTTTIPRDNTIPQSTEGDEYMSLSITPTKATNKLVISVVASLSSNAATNIMIGALFQDASADAVAAIDAGRDVTANSISSVVMNFPMIAGTVSLTDFKFRAGSPAAGTTTFNGTAGAGVLGGVSASSMVITEIEV